jgi:hypothetical protein
MISRRHVLCGLVAAPAIIKLAPLMRISPIYGEPELQQAEQFISFMRRAMVTPYAPLWGLTSDDEWQRDTRTVVHGVFRGKP